MNQTMKLTGIESLDAIAGGIPSRPLLWTHMFFLGRHGDEFFDFVKSFAKQERLTVATLGSWYYIPEADILLVPYNFVGMGESTWSWQNVDGNIHRLKKISQTENLTVVLQMRLPPQKYRGVKEGGSVHMHMAPTNEIEKCSDIVTSNWGTGDQKIWGCHKFLDLSLRQGSPKNQHLRDNTDI